MVGIILAFIVSILATAQNTMLKVLGGKKIEVPEEKKQLQKDSDSMMGLITAWASAGVAFIITTIVLVWLGGLSRVAELPIEFWQAAAWKIPLYALAVWSYALAHRKGDISLISPLLSITPAIIVVLAPMIGQTASPLGIAGVAFIVIGAYFLNFSQRKDGFLAPMKELWKDHGARFMMLTATLWAIVSVVDAVGVRTGGNDFVAAVMWTVVINLGSVVLLMPFALYFINKLKSKNEYQELASVQKFLGKSGAGKMTLTGFFDGTREVFQMMAMTFMQAAYVNAIKRFSMVLGVIVGAVVFKEKNFQERLTGSLIMLVGVIFIIISAVIK
ncbi:MAG: hypothetical protein Q7T51_03495 [Candidatus Moranbacteria bacterium]|nr:hypothetical protein [Candidatus Moranbacteria bacterium]